MKRLRKLIMPILVIMLSVSFGSKAEASEGGRSFNTDGYIITQMPSVYEVEATWKNLGEYGMLNHAEDLFMDENNQLYVVDTGNNRVLKMAASGEVLAEYTQGYGVEFRNPKGVYVHTDGSIWVADSGNYRIVRLDSDGNDLEVYYKPESSLLEDSFTFSPEKIYVSATGYIYVLRGSNLMLMDANNEFRGYVGTTAVPFSLQRWLIRTFGTQSQAERTLRQEPASYTNFMIASDGMTYGVLANVTSGQIRKLNSVGTNTYPEEAYGITIYNGTTVQRPGFSDINVMDNGIVTLCDQTTGLLYQYDQDGMLLAAFGGYGNAEGTYQNPISLVSDSDGKLYVLDFSSNTITVLAPTRFIQLVHSAITAYDAGNYDASKEYWEQVLEINSNYELAHQGYARILYKEDKFKEAMDEYYLGNDPVGYSQSFSEYRHELFREYFGWVVLAVIVILSLAWIGFKKLKNKVDELANKLEMGGWLS